MNYSISKFLFEKKEDPCWDDYEMVGTKEKDGKEVPNCVPKKESDELTEADETDEGNAFTGARQEAIDNDEDEFEVDGKSYEVTGEKENQNEARLRKLIRNMILEACYQGKKVTLDSPSSNSENPKKKSKVYVSTGEKIKSDGACKGEVKAKKVQFGDPNMKIRKSNPEARASFRARHKCSEKKPKDTPGYWSCKAW